MTPKAFADRTVTHLLNHLTRPDKFAAALNECTGSLEKFTSDSYKKAIASVLHDEKLWRAVAQSIKHKSTKEGPTSLGILIKFCTKLNIQIGPNIKTLIQQILSPKTGTIISQNPPKSQPPITAKIIANTLQSAPNKTEQSLQTSSQHLPDDLGHRLTAIAETNNIQNLEEYFRPKPKDTQEVNAEALKALEQAVKNTKFF